MHLAFLHLHCTVVRQLRTRSTSAYLCTTVPLFYPVTPEIVDNGAGLTGPGGLA